MRELSHSPRLRRLNDGDQPLPHLYAHAVPGHTPGHLFFVLQGAERDALFLGDAAKTRAELASGICEAALDAAQSKASIDLIWQHWRRKPDSIVIPGHDVPLAQTDGRIRYLDRHEAAIHVAYGDDPHARHDVSLTAIFK
ncbi:hypothetical protein D560_3901 [Bordetella holmesii ATCC 51541]|nr:hypothetical protein D560_3901 [Bordetella holmesii ATCC 51541]